MSFSETKMVMKNQRNNIGFYKIDAPLHVLKQKLPRNIFVPESNIYIDTTELKGGFTNIS